jgi:hypothetical protein
MPGTSYTNVDISKHGTTTAGQVDSVTFSTNWSEVIVVMKSPASGSAGLYVTADGSAPSASADGTDWVPPTAGAFVRIPLSGSSDVVKVFSATADTYMVKGVS